jgi:hypothetical protein
LGVDRGSRGGEEEVDNIKKMEEEQQKRELDNKPNTKEYKNEASAIFSRHHFTRS